MNKIDKEFDNIDEEISLNIDNNENNDGINLIMIYPTHYKIFNYKENRDKKFEEYLSVWDKALFKFTYQAYIYNEIEDILLVPGGVSRDTIDEYFPDYTFVDRRENLYNNYKPNKTIKVKYQPRDDTQRKALEFLFENTRSYRYSQRLLSLNTGDGKTYCAIKNLSITKRIPIIFINESNLLKQWKEKILEYTEDDEESIYVISGRPSIDKLLKMSKRKISSYKYFLCMHRTIYNYIGDNLNILNEFFHHINVSIKIFDEAHLEYENINKIDMLSNIPSLYLTATPSRSNYLEDRVYKIVFSGVIKFTSRSKKIKTKKENYHRIVVCKYNSNPDEDFLGKFQKKSSKRGFNVPFYSKYLLEEKMNYFYFPIKTILSKVIYPEKLLSKGIPNRTLILTKQILLVDKLYELILDDQDIDTDLISVGKFHSKISPKEKERVKEESHLIITTDSSMSTGQDIFNLRNIISTIPTSSAVLTEQMLGRLRYIDDENEVMYFDIVDIGFEECRTQLDRRRQRVYNKKAARLQELTL